MSIHIRFEDSNLSPFHVEPLRPVSHLQRLLLKDGITHMSRSTLSYFAVISTTLLITVGIHVGLSQAFPNAFTNLYAAIGFSLGTIYLALIAESQNIKEGLSLLGAAVATITLSVLGFSEADWSVSLSLYAHAIAGVLLFLFTSIDLIREKRIITAWITFSLISAILI